MLMLPCIFHVFGDAKQIRIDTSIYFFEKQIRIDTNRYATPQNRYEQIRVSIKIDTHPKQIRIDTNRYGQIRIDTNRHAPPKNRYEQIRIDTLVWTVFRCWSELCVEDFIVYSAPGYCGFQEFLRNLGHVLAEQLSGEKQIRIDTNRYEQIRKKTLLLVSIF